MVRESVRKRVGRKVESNSLLSKVFVGVCLRVLGGGKKEMEGEKECEEGMRVRARRENARKASLFCSFSILLLFFFFSFFFPSSSNLLLHSPLLRLQFLYFVLSLSELLVCDGGSLAESEELLVSLQSCLELVLECRDLFF